MATVRWEILEASMLPPTTASEVQIVCPIVAPIATPTAFLCVASAIVAIWLRSPHSARNVKMNDCHKKKMEKKVRDENIVF